MVSVDVKHHVYLRPGIKQRKKHVLRCQKVQQVRQSLFDSKIRSRWICTVTVRVWLWLRSADELAQPSCHVSRDTASAYKKRTSSSVCSSRLVSVGLGLLVYK